MTYTLEPCIDANISYSITVEVTYYTPARDAFLNGLPEDCTPAEDAECDYDITQIITYTEDETQVRIGNSLDMPSRVDESEFTRELIELHEQKLKDDAECKADYLYEESRLRR